MFVARHFRFRTRSHALVRGVSCFVCHVVAYGGGVSWCGVPWLASPKESPVKCKHFCHRRFSLQQHKTTTTETVAQRERERKDALSTHAHAQSVKGLMSTPIYPPPFVTVMTPHQDAALTTRQPANRFNKRCREGMDSCSWTRQEPPPSPIRSKRARLSNWSTLPTPPSPISTTATVAFDGQQQDRTKCWWKQRPEAVATQACPERQLRGTTTATTTTTTTKASPDCCHVCTTPLSKCGGTNNPSASQLSSRPIHAEQQTKSLLHYHFRVVKHGKSSKGPISSLAAPRTVTRCHFCDHRICSGCTKRCAACQQDFCSLCTVVDYTERTERDFCLDCVNHGKNTNGNNDSDDDDDMMEE